MRARRLLLPVLSCAALLAPAAARAEGLAFSPCPSSAGFECGTLTVPLDRSGALPGTVTLAVERVRASSNPGRRAVLTLAGGPGQAALPLAQDFASIMGAGLTDRDLLVFDQRGTGASGPLQCTALLPGRSSGSLLSDAQRCANQLGLARADYTTAQSVDDIESIRQAAGYDKLTIYGVSYGTKVALQYAARHPDRVDGLILDSVVGQDGPDPFHRSTFAATRRVLSELCSGGDCRGITSNPTRDLARAVRRLAAKRLSGTVVDGRGRHLRLSMDDVDLLQIALAGDVNPTLRAELPSSLHSALHGDRTPLLRLAARAEGLNQINGARPRQASGGDSDALFAATRCEETAFPWDRSADAITRLREAERAARSLSAATLSPFDRNAALGGELIPLCLGWPVASPPPPAPGPLPAVPTLILEGQADLRTPLEDGQAVAAQIPGATVVAIPHTGHSVLGSDLSTCGANAVKAFFAGQTPVACAPTSNLFFPTPVAPAKLARVHGANVRIKTVNAITATLDDVRRRFIGDSVAAGHAPRAGSRIGGLRAGYARYTDSGIVLRRISYVPGVAVSGLYRLGDKSNSTLTVSGRAASHGRITLHGAGRITGRLGGRRLALKASAAGARTAPAWPLRLPPFPALRAG